MFRRYVRAQTSDHNPPINDDLFAIDSGSWWRGAFSIGMLPLSDGS